MFFPIPEPVRRQAKSPHEVAMVNLVLFNLLMLIALLGGSFVESDSSLAPYKILGVAVPLCISLAIVAYTWVRARRAARDGPWFLAAHWRLAGIRYRILLIAYLVGTGLIGLGWLLAHAQKSAGMQDLMFIALQRVAIAPMLITLMVLVMLESGAIYQAQRGEVPDGLVKRVPPPADLAGADAEFASAPPSA
ncbi:hypothetical protein [uncultured Lamprocystis sp.]|jgi:hypothetical protein|uniref:hypothetical protein n=1 Tax=uncultured Lamprocystis sp. TaxID=543132 RepID=UPI0025EDB533|nr:hypothetical protein [uncultured Lamprocystis sp.]